MATFLTDRVVRSAGHPARALLPALVAALSISCAADPPMAPERTWEEVRYHWSQGEGDAGYGDVVIRASGEMVWVPRGQRALARGLLAGENLETLTRLVNALPPAGHSGSPGCSKSYFLTVVRDGETREYHSGDCDRSAPPSLAEIAARLDAWIEETAGNRRIPVPHRVLLEGTQSAVAEPGERVARSVEDLLAIVESLGSRRPVILPRVDFGRETVVALFLGSRPTGGHAVSVDGAYRTDGGQLVLRTVEMQPGPECAPATSPTSPFQIVAVETDAVGDLLIEAATRVAPCGGGSPR